jgi:hypothetical protein
VVTAEPGQNLPADQTERLRSHPGLTRAQDTDAAALQPPEPQVLVGAALAVDLVRVPGSRAVCCHLVNYAYDDQADAVTELTDVALAIRLADVPAGTSAPVVRPGRPAELVAVREVDGRSTLTLPGVGVHTVVLLDQPQDEQ